MRSSRYMFFLILTLLCVSVILSSCSDESTTPQLGKESVAGILRDEQSFIVPNALVEVLGTDNSVVASAISDEVGAFSLPELPADRSGLVIRITHEDFVPLVSSFSEVLRHTGTAVNLVNMIHGDSSCGRISALIRDVNTLAAIAGAEVRLTRNNALVTVTSTDANGRVQFNFLREGRYVLRVAKPNYQVVEREVQVHFCDSTSLDIRMAPGGIVPRDSCCHGIVRVSVVDSASNAPMVNAQVKLSGPTINTRTVVVQGNAPVVFDGLCPGTYALRVARDQFKVQEFQLVITCNEQRNITVRLKPAASSVDTCCHGRLTVVAVDSASGAPIPNMTIKLWKASTVVQTRVTGPSGTAIFENLCPGQYALDGRRENNRGTEIPVTMGCNDIKTVTMLIRPLLPPPPPDTCCHGRLNVMVKDSATGLFLDNATVKIWNNGLVVATKTTTPNGNVVFENLCQKNYGISVIRSGFATREMMVPMGCNDNKAVTILLKANATTVDSCHTAKLKFFIKNGSDPTQPPLQGVTVTITMANTNPPLFQGTSDVNGFVGREGLFAPMVYFVTFSKPGFATKSISFRFDTCKTIQETITMTP